MLGNFSYHNPTKLYFGDESLNFLKDELNNFGPVVLLNYGSGSVKRNGIYDQVVAILNEAGKTVVENPGVMSNPTLEKLNEGVKIARDNNVDLILALGGGSVCDYSKAVAASVFCDGDYWDKFWLKQEQPAADQRLLPVACVLTMAGTGSEMNAGNAGWVLRCIPWMKMRPAVSVLSRRTRSLSTVPANGNLPKAWNSTASAYTTAASWRASATIRLLPQSSSGNGAFP